MNAIDKVIAELRERHGYWGDHPEYPPDDWKYEVANGDSRRSYWEWVASKLDDWGGLDIKAEEGTSDERSESTEDT